MPVVFPDCVGRRRRPSDWRLAELDSRVGQAIGRAETALQNLATAIPLDGNGSPQLGSVVPDSVRDALQALAGFGMPDALHASAVGDSDHIRRILAEQGLRALALGTSGVAHAKDALGAAAATDVPGDRRLAHYRDAAQQIFGPPFNLVPRFAVTNSAELVTAAAFRDQPAGLTRFHQDNPLLVDEWLQGAARVRERVSDLQSAIILSELVSDPQTSAKPLQLPHRPSDH
jgi:hypothetical protein